MDNKLSSNAGLFSHQFEKESFFSNIKRRSIKRVVVLLTAFALVFSLAMPLPFFGDGNSLFAPSVSANGTYHNFSGGNLTMSINSGTTGLINQNDNWSGVTSVEGYEGDGLTANNAGIDPQLILGTETPGSTLPSAAFTKVAANKNNPNAYNAGGVAEFDAGPIYSLGLQGNNGKNPYIIFYLNTSGRSSITVNYEITDIDNGMNNSVSPVALQYRIGETGNFTNIPAGFVADATQGPTQSGLVTPMSVLLPSACNNQAQVQVRLITSDASSQDEWIGVNNITASAFAPTAATANVGGQVISPYGRPLANATITMLDVAGNTRIARSNAFGYYNFPDVGVGETYVFEIRSKRFNFPQPTQVITVNDNIDSLNFYAEPYANFWTDFSMRR